MTRAVGKDERVRAAAVREAPKHTRLLRSARGGKVLSALMLPFFMVRPPFGYAVLTTTGRRTGKARRRCIRVIRRGERAYLVSLRPPELAISRPNVVAAWVRNIRANPQVSLRMREGTFAGTARELDDPAELEKAREAICETVVPFDYGECALHLRGRPSRQKVKELHRYWFETGIPILVQL
jgi:deazaflavin-dependent oxidoreductase (nitroreductase family)